MKLGVITTGALGWRTLGQRWREHLSSRVPGDTFFLEIQDFEGIAACLPWVRRHAWLRAAIRGRRAAKEAIRRGADTILLCTIVDAPLLPRKESVRYLVYGDATPRQLDRLYYNDDRDTPRKRFLRDRIARLAREGHTFLCMSEWYRQGVITDYGARNTVILQPFLDTDLWRPCQDRSEQLPLRALFVGGDFRRKGGDVLLELAERFSASEVDWHVVTSEAHPAPPHVRFYTGLGPDHPELIRLAQSCHVCVFPTRADCSPLAVLEAGAVGLPVVTTHVGGLSDMVESGINGQLLAEASAATFAPAIERYLADRRRLAEEGVAARQRVVEQNSIEAHFNVLGSALDPHVHSALRRTAA